MWIRDILLRTRILVFSSVAFKTAIKKMSTFFLLNSVLFESTFTSFFKIKIHKNSRNKSFSYYFCLMIEGSGAGDGPRTNGFGRPKNIRIRIRNTAGSIGSSLKSALKNYRMITFPRSKCKSFQMPSRWPILRNLRVKNLVVLSL